MSAHSSSRIHRVLAFALGLGALIPLAGEAMAQELPQLLPVGTPAPEITFTAASRWGEIAEPVTLSDFRGKTVVLAFYPAARTRGCTIQMESYRDRYGELFRGGRGVALIAISYDPVETLSDWAMEQDFPQLFGSDPSGEAYRAFGGTTRENGMVGGRSVVVVNPDGIISGTIPRFREVDPTAYDELAALVEASAGDVSDEME